MVSVWIGLLLLSLMIFVVIEMRKEKKLKRRDQLIDELKQANEDLEDTDLREDVIEAKAKLQKRTAQVDKKEGKVK